MEEKRRKFILRLAYIFAIIAFAGLFYLFADWVTFDFIMVNLRQHYTALAVSGIVFFFIVVLDFVLIETIFFNTLKTFKK